MKNVNQFTILNVRLLKIIFYTPTQKTVKNLHNDYVLCEQPQSIQGSYILTQLVINMHNNNMDMYGKTQEYNSLHNGNTDAFHPLHVCFL